MLLKLFCKIFYTFSMLIATHLFVFIVLTFVLLLTYIDEKRIAQYKQWFVNNLFKIIGKKIRVKGYENVKENTRYLIVSNYPSAYAGFALAGTFPNAFFIAASFISKIPLFGRIMRRIGTIFINQRNSFKAKRSIDIGLSSMNSDGSIIIFPEGGPSKDGNFSKFKRGFLYI